MTEKPMIQPKSRSSFALAQSPNENEVSRLYVGVNGAVCLKTIYGVRNNQIRITLQRKQTAQRP